MKYVDAVVLPDRSALSGLSRHSCVSPQVENLEDLLTKGYLPFSPKGRYRAAKLHIYLF